LTLYIMWFCSQGVNANGQTGSIVTVDDMKKLLQKVNIFDIKDKSMLENKVKQRLLPNWLKNRLTEANIFPTEDTIDLFRLISDLFKISYIACEGYTCRNEVTVVQSKHQTAMFRAAQHSGEVLDGTISVLKAHKFVLKNPKSASRYLAKFVNETHPKMSQNDRRIAAVNNLRSALSLFNIEASNRLEQASNRIKVDLVKATEDAENAKAKGLRCHGTDNGCCTADQPCKIGDGDCDLDNQCAGDLVCGTDNCPWGDGDDCCMEDPGVEIGLTDPTSVDPWNQKYSKEMALDENLETYFSAKGPGKKGEVRAASSPPWWKVRLQNEALVKQVRIHLNKDYFKEGHFHGLKVETSNDDKVWVTCSDEAISEPIWPHVIHCTNTTLASYVRISVPSITSYLAIYQVKVFATIPQPCKTDCIRTILNDQATYPPRTAEVGTCCASSCQRIDTRAKCSHSKSWCHTVDGKWGYCAEEAGMCKKLDHKQCKNYGTTRYAVKHYCKNRWMKDNCCNYCATYLRSYEKPLPASVLCTSSKSNIGPKNEARLTSIEKLEIAKKSIKMAIHTICILDQVLKGIKHKPDNTETIQALQEDSERSMNEDMYDTFIESGFHWFVYAKAVSDANTGLVKARDKATKWFTSDNLKSLEKTRRLKTADRIMGKIKVIEQNLRRQSGQCSK